MLIDVKTFFHNIHYSVPWTTGRRSANLGRSGTATDIKRKYNFSQWKSYLPLVLYRKKKNRNKITPTRSSPTTEGQVQLNWSNSGSGQARGLEVCSSSAWDDQKTVLHRPYFFSAAHEVTALPCTSILPKLARFCLFKALFCRFLAIGSLANAQCQFFS